MDTKTMFAIALIVVVIVGALTISFVNAKSDASPSTVTTKCSGCGNSCTKDNNCGSPTCGATEGKPCGCNKG